MDVHNDDACKPIQDAIDSITSAMSVIYGRGNVCLSASESVLVDELLTLTESLKEMNIVAKAGVEGRFNGRFAEGLKQCVVAVELWTHCDVFYALLEVKVAAGGTGFVSGRLEDFHGGGMMVTIECGERPKVGAPPNKKATKKIAVQQTPSALPRMVLWERSDYGKTTYHEMCNNTSAFLKALGLPPTRTNSCWRLLLEMMFPEKAYYWADSIERDEEEDQ